VTSSEGITATLALLSLVASVFAAIAAFRSAGSAAATQASADDMEHRAALRQIAMTATEIVVEARRIASRAIHLRLLYSNLAVFSANVGGSRETLSDNAVQEKVGAAEKLADHAKLFLNSAIKLANVPESETDRVQVDLSTKLLEVQAIHLDMERDISDVASQVGDYRRKAI